MAHAETLHRIEPFWDAQVAVGAAIVLDGALPAKLVVDPRWVIPAIGTAGLLVLMLITPWRSREPPQRSAHRRRLFLGVMGVVAAAHVGSLVALVVQIVDHRGLAGGDLLRAAGQLWTATVLIFAVLYWDLDRKGPVERSHDGPVPQPLPPGWNGPWPDFLFAQMADDTPSPRHWMPGFVDYLYLAATNSTAFSPTDVMPLSRSAKLLMLVQSSTSFVLVALVAARAVNVLAT